MARTDQDVTWTEEGVAQTEQGVHKPGKQKLHNQFRSLGMERPVI